MKVLTEQDCEVVSGGLNPIGAVMGGVAGSAIYGGFVINSGWPPSQDELARAAIRGAFTGFLVSGSLFAAAAMIGGDVTDRVPGRPGLASAVLGVAMLGGAGGLAAGAFERLSQ